MQTVVEIAATIDVSELTTSISRTLDLKPLNAAGVLVEGVVLSPNRVEVTIDVEQLVGYRMFLSRSSPADLWHRATPEQCRG